MPRNSTSLARPNAEIISRFWPKVQKSDDGCWEWTAARDSDGYGRLQIGGRKGRSRYAHRLSYAIEHGETPGGLVRVLHTCDNRACVRPDHLFLGTQEENLQDRTAKGRSNSKLTEDQVRAIFTRCFTESHTALGVEFGVSPAAIWMIAKGRTWLRVTGYRK